MSTANDSMRIYSRPGVAEGALSMEIDVLDIHHTFIITDRSIAASGLVQRLSRQLPGEIGITIYAETPLTPTETAANDAAALYAAHGCDGIIGLGNSAAIDLARLTGLLATHRGPLRRYDRGTGGAARIRDAIPPIIAIAAPETANEPISPDAKGAADTPLDMGHNAISVRMGDRQIEVYSPHLVPKAAIRDSELTLHRA